MVVGFGFEWMSGVIVVCLAIGKILLMESGLFSGFGNFLDYCFSLCFGILIVETFRIESISWLQTMYIFLAFDLLHRFIIAPLLMVGLDIFGSRVLAL